MSYKLTQSTDGGAALYNVTTGKTAMAFSANGRAKELTAASTLTEADNGLTFYLNSTTEFATTLPSPFLGAEYTFIVKTAPSGASYTVVTGSSANIIKGIAFNGEAAGVGDSGSADDTISFVDGQALAGDTVVLSSDGTSWFARAFCKVAAGITFTQAST